MKDELRYLALLGMLIAFSSSARASCPITLRGASGVVGKVSVELAAFPADELPCVPIDARCTVAADGIMLELHDSLGGTASRVFSTPGGVAAFLLSWSRRPVTTAAPGQTPPRPAPVARPAAPAPVARPAAPAPVAPAPVARPSAPAPVARPSAPAPVARPSAPAPAARQPDPRAEDRRRWIDQQGGVVPRSPVGPPHPAAASGGWRGGAHRFR